MPPITSGTGVLKDRPYDERMQHLFMAVFFTGVFQFAFGLLGLTRFLSMVPKTAMIGFLNGLSLVMFYAQLPTFQQCPLSVQPDFHTCMRDGTLEWMAPRDPSTWTTVFLVVLTMFIMHVFPKLPRIGHLVPPTLVVALVCVGLEFGVHRPLLHAPTRTIRDISPLSDSSFPTPRWPSLGSSPNWTIIVTTSASLSIVGIFESLLTLQVVCELTQRPVTNAMCRQETLAQGLGNVVCGLFGAMGGASMIGQSTGSILNGARGRLSAVVGGFVMLAVVMGAGPVVEVVPVACLTGVMFIICYHTFYWPTFRLLLRLQLVDVVGIVLVTALAAAINLAVAVIGGIVWHALVHVWQHSRLLTHTTFTEVEPDGTDIKVYAFKGTFLFSSATAFRDAFASVHDDPATVVVDFAQCLIVDFSAVAAVRQVALRYRQLGKKLVVRHLNDESKREFTNDLPWVHTHHVTVAQPNDTDSSTVHVKEIPDDNVRAIRSEV
ncbi:hypothetical protein, variant [Aphanomyces invadans]|nr:hypothetical protein, variant [Aphanomyces invadans]ETV99384.1 hypothetical protein, variant [Aphanomyces invadans]|eukprot:XP_008871940.1 hypothetical protein, variant [Aphanomyces invadans]